MAQYGPDHPFRIDGLGQVSHHTGGEAARPLLVEGVGSLSMWREVYRDAYYMTQS